MGTDLRPHHLNFFSTHNTLQKYYSKWLPFLSLGTTSDQILIKKKKKNEQSGHWKQNSRWDYAFTSYFQTPFIMQITNHSQFENYCNKTNLLQKWFTRVDILGWVFIGDKYFQKQPSRDVLEKGVLIQLYWNHTSASVFSCKFATYFQNNFS